MTAEDFVVENGGDRETVKAIRERLPQFDGEATFALVVKSVDPAQKEKIQSFEPLGTKENPKKAEGNWSF